MGTWGEGAFDNDAAGDWAWELAEADDLSVIEAALDALLDEEDDVESGLAEEAIAACETVARLKGQFGERSGYTEEVDKWVAAHPQQPPTKLVQRALKALERATGENSELRQCWKEGEEGKWLAAMADLKKRLQA